LDHVGHAAHELTHVLLADRSIRAGAAAVGRRRLGPVADPLEKQAGHDVDFASRSIVAGNFAWSNS